MIYDFKNIERVYFIGDVHGCFPQFRNTVYSVHMADERHRKIKTNEPTLWIVCGDIGLGFNKDEYYAQIFNEFNEQCAKRNISIILVRGNHDDPSYFNDEKINYSNIKAVSDYSVLQTRVLTILCVGGGLSIDRSWRKSEEIKRNKYSKSKRYKYYWEDEMPIFSKEKLDDLKEQGIIVNAIASHTAPSFCYPLAKDASFSWFRVDNKLRDDLKIERETMDSIFNWFKENEQPIMFWGYGHFHTSNLALIEDCAYLALCECECRNVNEYLDMSMMANKERLSNKPKLVMPFDEWDVAPLDGTEDGVELPMDDPRIDEHLIRPVYNIREEDAQRIRGVIDELLNNANQPF